MKITPVSQGGALPGANVGAAATSPDRLAAAKAVFEGREKPKADDPQVERLQQNIRSIKMRTQASPDRPFEAQETIEEPTTDQSATPDASGQTEAAEETKPLSPQFAALARQKRALQVKEREIADREKALEARAGATDGTAIDLSRLKSDPLGVLQQAGVTYEQLTEAILSGGSDPAVARVRELEDKLAALEKGFDSKLTERDSAAEKQVLTEMRREADQLIQNQDSSYELVKATNSTGKAIDLIYRTWKETGETMDVSEALQLVEDHLLEENLKIARLSKIQSRLTPAEEAQVMAQQQQPQPQPAMRTLTSRDNARPLMSRRDRALAAFYGNLKK